MSIMEEGKRTRRRYTPEYKAEAVKLVRQSGKTVHAVARDLGLIPTVLRRWVRQAEIDSGSGPSGALTTQEREELAKLRRENQTLRMERDFLKKTAAWFAKESK